MPVAQTSSTHAFELIERVSPEAFLRHPIWAHYEAEVDRSRLLDEGVPARVLDSAEERFLQCGLVPLYPVLEPGPPDSPSDRLGQLDLLVASQFVSASGQTLQGYLLDPLAFGVFHEDKEFSFNRSLPDFSAREAGRLAESLGITTDTLFPLQARVDPRIKSSKLDGPREILGF